MSWHKSAMVQASGDGVWDTIGICVYYLAVSISLAGSGVLIEANWGNIVDHGVTSAFASAWYLVYTLPSVMLWVISCALHFSFRKAAAFWVIALLPVGFFLLFPETFSIDR